MRNLTDQEKKLLNQVRQDYYIPARKELGDAFQHGNALEIGLIAGLDYQDKKLKAYAAFVNGSITRAELDKVLNDDLSTYP